MPRYTVAHRYTSTRDGQRYGPWQRGETVELSEADAAWVNRDSPGALDVDPDPEPEPPPVERNKTTTRDRQHRGGRTR
jgi:hypothetical protein